MFRWGVLSTAKIGLTQVIPALCASENGGVHGIASRDLSKARAVADRFGAKLAFGSYEELLESDEIDGVYIPLPTSQHIEWSLKAAAAGKHVLCEKPIALKADDIDALIEARDRYGVQIVEAFMVFYHPQWLKVRELLEQGAIGTLRHVTGVFTYFNVDPANMRNQPALGGGGLPDIGVYPVVAARMTTGKEPLKVLATVDYDPQFGTDRYASVNAQFDGFNFNFYIATQMAGRQSMVFHGDKGFIEVHAPFNAGKYDHARVSLHDAPHMHTSEWTFQDINQYQLQAEQFVRAAQGEDVALFTLESSKANQRFIDAIYRAGKNAVWSDI